MKLAPSCLLALVSLSALFVSTARGEDWPQHRGPRTDGSALASGALARDFDLEVAWKRPAGSGYSGISVAEGRMVTMWTDGKDDLLVALDPASGKDLWRFPIGPMTKGHDGSDNGPISTPAIDRGTVYSLSPAGRFVAVSLAAGKELWSRQLGETEARMPFYGFSTSPIVAGDAVLLMTGKLEGRALTAFDRATGKTLWSHGDTPGSYQSPVLATIAGKPQILLAGDFAVLGLDPATGEVLWQHRLIDKPGEGRENDEASSPLPVGGDRFLLMRNDATRLFHVERGAAGFAATEVWQAPVFQNSLVQPVVQGGYVYGFSGRFLTCIEVATGKVVWKSRPPGGRNLGLVDGHLVVVGSDGSLVIGEASPAGFVEKTRTAVLATDTLSAPTWAEGSFFVRDLKEIASLHLAPRTAAKAEVDPWPRAAGPVGDFVARLRAATAAERSKISDEFFAAHPEMPIVEPDGTTHFLYRGEATDVAVLGSVVAAQDGQPLRRLPETDVFLTSLPLDAAAIYEYSLQVNFGDPQVDPRNSRKMGSPQGERSALPMPGFHPPAHLALPTGPRGRIEKVNFASKLLGDEREVRVYLPAGYDTGDRRYPLLLVNNGDGALDFGLMGNTLDNLIGKSVEPLIVAFLPRSRAYIGAAADYSKMLVEELLPHLDRTYRTLAKPEARGIFGAGSGGFSAIYTVFHHPGIFGAAGTQSFYGPPPLNDELWAKIAANPPLLQRVYLEQAKIDLVVPGPGFDAKVDSAKLRAALAAKGYPLTVVETAGAPGWGHWRASHDKVLEALFPLGR